jgi:fatty-acyl-CoA synthase
MSRAGSALEVGMTMSEALEAAADRSPDAPALVCGDERQSLREIRAASDHLARILQTRGVRATDRVAMLLSNGAAFVHALFGICRLGAVAVPLDVRSTVNELEELVASAGVVAIVVDPELPLAGSSRSLESVAVELVGRERTLTPGDTELCERVDSCPDLPDRGSVAASDPAIVFCTSGTTGRPKMVRHSHRTVIASTMGLHRLHAGFFDGTTRERVHRMTTVLRRHGLRLLHATGQQVWMTPIGFSSVSGQQVALGALLGGHRLVTMRSFHPRVALELIQDEKVNILAATPSMAELMLSVRGADSLDTSSMLIVGLGGGPVSPELAAAVRERFRCGVGIGYGSTELGGGVLVSRLEDPVEVQTGTVGRPFPGAEVELVDDRGEGVTQGHVGELRCKVPGSTEPGWYRTGDLASMDGLGNVRIVGRKSDMIVRGGQNVYPQEIERVLELFPAVERSAVVGVAGGPSGEQVWAFVTLRLGSTATSREILGHCRERLTGYKVPDHLLIRDALPVTAEGKIQKFRLAEEAAASLTARSREVGSRPG